LLFFSGKEKRRKEKYVGQGGEKSLYGPWLPQAEVKKGPCGERIVAAVVHEAEGERMRNEDNRP